MEEDFFRSFFKVLRDCSPLRLILSELEQRWFSLLKAFFILYLKFQNPEVFQVLILFATNRKIQKELRMFLGGVQSL